jgi:hypothetical protein
MLESFTTPSPGFIQSYPVCSAVNGNDMGIFIKSEGVFNLLLRARKTGLSKCSEWNPLLGKSAIIGI